MLRMTSNRNFIKENQIITSISSKRICVIIKEKEEGTKTMVLHLQLSY